MGHHWEEIYHESHLKEGFWKQVAQRPKPAWLRQRQVTCLALASLIGEGWPPLACPDSPDPALCSDDLHTCAREEASSRAPQKEPAPCGGFANVLAAEAGRQAAQGSTPTQSHPAPRCAVTELRLLQGTGPWGLLSSRLSPGPHLTLTTMWKGGGGPLPVPAPHLHLQKSRACTYNDNPQPQHQFPAQRFSKCFTQSPSLLILITALRGQVHVPAAQLRRWRPRGDGTCLSSNSKNWQNWGSSFSALFCTKPPEQCRAVEEFTLQAQGPWHTDFSSQKPSEPSPKNGSAGLHTPLPPGSPAGWVGAKTPG